jgi:hypothetical protein
MMEVQNGGKYLIRDFKDTLKELRAGSCETEATEKLNKLVEGCVKTGKKGTFTLKLTVTPKGAQVIVKDDIKAPVPEHEAQPTLMFVDGDNNLVRRNPMQPNLPGTVKVQEEPEAVNIGEHGEVVAINVNQ